MATIQRHAVPADSYDPNRPLNDLGRDQFEHFKHVAQHLPPGFRLDEQPPSADDAPAATRYIAAVTERLMAARKGGLTLLPKRPRKQSARVVDLAAAAETKSRKTPAKETAQRKSLEPKTAAAKAAAAKPSKGKVVKTKSRKAGGGKP